MENNKVYKLIIIALMIAIVFLVLLLFVSDAGRYCKPTIKEEIDFPKRK